MKEIIREMVAEALKVCVEAGDLPEGLPERWTVEVPKNPVHGDYATNVAMVLAGTLRRSPLEIADRLVRRIPDRHDLLERVEVKAPGFVNFFIRRDALHRVLREIVTKAEMYGRSDFGRGVSVQVEFVSANPTGPLHVGHGRGAAVGDVLARLLEEVGFRVWREYYINDVGRQMEVLGRSTYLRYLQLLGKEVELPDDHYQGDYVRLLARELLEAHGDRFVHEGESEVVSFFTDYSSRTILGWIKSDLEKFRVRYDAWFNESLLYSEGIVEKAIGELKKKGLLYEKDGAFWFKSTDFGDEKDRVVIRSDGSTTYFASDIAYHMDKFQRGFHKVIDIWGADHHGYIKRLKGVVKALGRDEEDLKVLLVQMVNLVRDGVPVSMSTRAGKFATLREVIEEVGVDAARYTFLMRSCDSHLDFDLELLKRQEKENPVYYVQYAHARICSIMKEAQERGIQRKPLTEVNLSLLELEEELDIIKHLIGYPEVVLKSAIELEPHRITYYLDELAALFHNYYNKGWIDPRCRVLCADKDLAQARLVLVEGVRVVLRNALRVLGVNAPERM